MFHNVHDIYHEVYYTLNLSNSIFTHNGLNVGLCAPKLNFFKYITFIVSLLVPHPEDQLNTGVCLTTHPLVT
jgi:hypothetical protein